MLSRRTHTGCNARRTHTRRTHAGCNARRTHTRRTHTGCNARRTHTRRTHAGCNARRTHTRRKHTGCNARRTHARRTHARPRLLATAYFGRNNSRGVHQTEVATRRGKIRLTMKVSRYAIVVDHATRRRNNRRQATIDGSRAQKEPAPQASTLTNLAPYL